MEQKATPNKIRKERRGRALALGGMVGEILEASGGSEVAKLARLLPHWQQVVPTLHAWCWPVGLSRGVLEVAVASDSVRQQLHYEAPGVVRLLNMVLGGESVKKMTFKAGVLGVTGTKKAVAPSTVEPCAAAVDKAWGLCEHVRDEELGVALAALGAFVCEEKRRMKP